MSSRAAERSAGCGLGGSSARKRVVMLTGLIVAIILYITPTVVGAATLDPTITAALPADLAAATERLTRPVASVPLPPLPSNPLLALVTAVNAHSASLGFTVDHSHAILTSGMSNEYAG